MANFFTVDRLGKLKASQVLDLQIYADVMPPVLQSLVDSLVPEGVSQHGEQYLLKNPNSQLKAVANSPIEMFFELFRRARFPTRPSRYQSWFAAETLEEAQAFRQKYGNPANSIWEVEANSFFKANMSLLKPTNSMLCQAYLAQCYWNGSEGPSGELKIPPFWEVLLMPPVKVIQEIKQTAPQTIVATTVYGASLVPPRTAAEFKAKRVAKKKHR